MSTRFTATPDHRFFTRRQVAMMIGGVDVSFVIRLEREGRLKGIRFGRSPSAKIFFRLEEVNRFIEELSNAPE